MEQVKNEAKMFPETPGVYLMHNQVDEIIYVGKAVNLKRRVLQYFTESGKRSKKIEQMIANIDHISAISTETELEALILESNLIKQYRPRYNSALRRDENHPYIVLDPGDDFPVLSIDIGISREKNLLYLGPFYKSMDPEEIVLLLSSLLGLRTCSKDFSKGDFDHRPCLRYSMGQCSGVCLERCSKGQYREKLQQALDFLKGNDRESLLQCLENRMQAAAEAMDFEAAARYRNRREELQTAREKLDAAEHRKRKTLHLWAFAGDLHKAHRMTAVLYLISGTNLSGRDTFQYLLQERHDSKNRTEEVIRQIPVQGGKDPKQESSVWLDDEKMKFLLDFYRNAPEIPSEILLADLSETDVLEQIIRKERQADVFVHQAASEEQIRLAALARKSAYFLEEFL
ncbi:MAG: GIY-YIG nuclease family protein [Lachnospiraceae bacterium]|nr:GIY-YIG nuclease family protein [Lachnospiraceae bacterium]